MPFPLSGPTSNLPGEARRRGRSGQVFDGDGNFLGEVTAVEWNVEIEQIDVLIPGSWRNQQIPGAETRTGTFRHQDIDDRWKMQVYDYIKRRRTGDRGVRNPTFNLIVAIDDQHSPFATRWQLTRCQLFSYSGGYSQEDDLITREIPFSFQDDQPLEAFVYASTPPSGDDLLAGAVRVVGG
jgi:hypothetical protein